MTAHNSRVQVELRPWQERHVGAPVVTGIIAYVNGGRDLTDVRHAVTARALPDVRLEQGQHVVRCKP